MTIRAPALTSRPATLLWVPVKKIHISVERVLVDRRPMIAMGSQPPTAQWNPIMLKFSTLALAALLGVVFLAPAPALAIDKGPCDHCTMDPIVVKGDRKKK